MRCSPCSGVVHLKLFECGVHGTCTAAKKVDGHGCCAGCKDRPRAESPVATFPPVGRRHLAYHILPVAGRWRRGADQLRRRWSLFDGRRVVSVATGGPVAEQGTGVLIPLDPPDMVRAYLPPGCEVVEVPNDPDRWEAASWPAMWAKVLAGAAPDDAVLYAHAKGVTRPMASPAHRWADLLYELALDRWPATAADLSRHPVSGPLRKNHPLYAGRTHGKVLSGWHYSGNFWWARVGPLRSRLAAVPVPADPWGPEAWPGIAWTMGESGCVWTPAGGFDLYRPRDMARVDAQYHRWAKANPAAPPAPAGVRLSIIVPTSGRGSLAHTLESITSQLLPGDQVFVERDATGDWGATPRTRAQAAATGDYLMFMDDDDEYLPGALAAVRQALAAAPGRPHLFRMRRGEPFHDIVPREPALRVGNVSTQIVVVPNDPRRLGTWGTRYEGDYDFIASTLAHYPDGPVWRDEVICEWRPPARG